HMRRWGHVRLFSPSNMNITPLARVALQADDPRFEFPPDGDCITGREHVEAFLEPLAHASAVADCVRTETQVVCVGKRGLLKDDSPGNAARGEQPFRILLREAKGREYTEEADIVLDCTGTFGSHRWVGDGGIPAVGELAAESHIAYGL